MIQLKPGEQIRLPLLLEDGNEDRYPQVTIYDNAGNQVAQFDLVHQANGLYLSPAWSSADVGIFEAVFIVYKDANHTEVDTWYGRALETIVVSTAGLTYDIGFSSSYDEQQDRLYITTWLEVNGLVQSTNSCNVKMYDPQGNLMFELTSNTPDAYGIFRLEKGSPNLAADRVYMAIIEIDGKKAVKALATFD